MIRKYATILLLSGLFQFCAQGQETYQLDTKQSKILWTTKVGGHSGSLLFHSGTLYYPAGEPTGGVFSMDMKSIRSTDKASESDRKKSEATIQTKEFFYVGMFPSATMTVKTVTRIGTSTDYKVSGDLTIKGITQPIAFTASIIKKEKTVSIKAAVDMHRLKWEIDVPSKPQTPGFISGITEAMVPPDIHISLDLVLNQFIAK